jgi:hypothetical protein
MTVDATTPATALIVRHIAVNIYSQMQKASADPRELGITYELQTSNTYSYSSTLKDPVANGHGHNPFHGAPKHGLHG